MSFFNNNNNCYNNDCCNNNQVDSCCDERNNGSCCTTCPPGPQGPVGERGPRGPQGPAGGVLNFADFYALMPPDNAATVAPGTDVSFPQDGPTSGQDIVRTGPSSFNLGLIGTYQIFFQVGVTEAGQLILTLNGEDLEYTVSGRATGTSQIIGMALVTTTSVNSILTVRNPAGNAAALGITPLAGGTRPVFCTFDYYSNSVIVSDLPLICAPRSLAVKALRKQSFFVSLIWDNHI